MGDGLRTGFENGAPFTAGSSAIGASGWTVPAAGKWASPWRSDPHELRAVLCRMPRDPGAARSPALRTVQEDHRDRLALDGGAPLHPLRTGDTDCRSALSSLSTRCARRPAAGARRAEGRSNPALVRWEFLLLASVKCTIICLSCSLVIPWKNTPPAPGQHRLNDGLGYFEISSELGQSKTW